MTLRGSTLTNLWDINNDGTMVGTYVGTDGLFHGFTFVGTTYTTIDVPGGSTLTEVTGVNNNNQMVGIYFDSASAQHGFTLAAGKYKPVNYPGALVTAVDRINDSGELVGLFGASSSGPFTGYTRVGTTYTAVTFPDPLKHGFEVSITAVPSSAVTRMPVE